MKNFPVWFYIIGAVAIALLANTISTLWAKGEDRFSFWLLAVLIISPMVFITFGLTTSKLGLAITSGIVDSLLILSTIAVGLIVFQEWNKISGLQYVGMALALCGIFLMLYFPKTGS